jgi:branched-subunit amino acid transport protein AzlD
MNTPGQALGIVFAMAAVILFCRAFPFLFFREKPSAGEEAGNGAKPGSPGHAFLGFVERIVPPAAMTVLAVNNLGGTLNGDFRRSLPALIAAAAVALLHLGKRNSLISIFGGTAIYMILERIIIQN